MNAIQKFIEAEHKYLDLKEIDYKEYEQTISPLRDVECVVRCKDCKHGRIFENFVKCENAGNPGMFATYHRIDWYCADGERK